MIGFYRCRVCIKKERETENSGVLVSRSWSNLFMYVKRMGGVFLCDVFESKALCYDVCVFLFSILFMSFLSVMASATDLPISHSSCRLLGIQGSLLRIRPILHTSAQRQRADRHCLADRGADAYPDSYGRC